MRYDRLVEEALRSVVRTAMSEVAQNGLPGEHHFYITFKTRYPGVEIPVYLKQKYEDEMTIVLQHQYWGLKADADGFEVLLSFNDVHERLAIPYAAITGFVDPSVKFGLQFQVQSDEDEAKPVLATEAPAGSNGVTPLVPAAGRGEADAPAEKPAKKAKAAKAGPKPAEPTEEPPTDAGANVVTLDTFRKK